jgi:NADH-quinone oxidoreductase subunit G
VDMGVYPTAGGKDAMAIIDGCAAGSIKILYVAGENPVVSYPDRKRTEAALDKVDFLVVQDLFLTETAAMADVVLPACSFAEKTGTFTSVGRAVQKLNQAIKPLGQARPDLQIFADLVGALTGSPAAVTAAQVFAEITAALPAYAGLTYAGLGDQGAVYPVATTPRFVAVAAQPVAAVAGKYALLGGSALYHCGTMSRFGEGPMLVCPEGYLELNRDDATQLGIVEGEAITVKADSGELKLKAKVANRLPKGVVFAPYHFAEQSVNTIATGAPVTWVSISK